MRPSTVCSFIPSNTRVSRNRPTSSISGAAPNQQIIPAVRWTFDNLGHRFYLVGSDYVFPRAANAVITDQIKALGGSIVGEDYIPLGQAQDQDVVARITAAHPDVILNTINGDTNIAFFRSLRAAGICPTRIPTVSFSIGENELPALNPATCVGDYAVWNYFQTLGGSRNKEFVSAFKKKYGADRVVSDPMEAGYCAVKLWAQAVEEAGTDNTERSKRPSSTRAWPRPRGW